MDRPGPTRCPAHRWAGPVRGAGPRATPEASLINRVWLPGPTEPPCAVRVGRGHSRGAGLRTEEGAGRPQPLGKGAGRIPGTLALTVRRDEQRAPGRAVLRVTQRRRAPRSGPRPGPAWERRTGTEKPGRGTGHQVALLAKLTLQPLGNWRWPSSEPPRDPPAKADWTKALGLKSVRFWVFVFVCFLTLRMERRASRMLSTCCTTDLHGPGPWNLLV